MVLRAASLVALLLTVGGTGTVAVLHAQPADLRFERFGIDDGLPSTRVHNFVQDHLGYLWIEGDEGVCRYDGYACTYFRHDPVDSTSLSGNEIIDLHVDRSGTLWVIAPNTGLNRFDSITETFERILHDPADPNSPSSNDLNQIEETPDGALWLSGASGVLNRFDPATSTFEHIRLDPTLASLGFSVRLASADGTVWLSVGGDMGRRPSERGGLYQYDPAADTLIWHLGPGETDGLVDGRILSVHEDADGILWVGTCNLGLHRYDPATGDLERYLFDPDDPESLRREATRSGSPEESLRWIDTFLEGPDGHLWFTGEGLTRYDRTTRSFTHYTTNPIDPYSLSMAPYSLGLYQTRDGTIWVGTWAGGVNKATPGFRRSWHVVSGLGTVTFSRTYGFYEDAQRRLWLATSTGLFRLLPGSPVSARYRPAPAIEYGDRMNAVAGGRDGRIWVGTYVGLHAFDPRTDAFTAYRHDPDDPSSLSHDTVEAVLVDRAGAVWAGTPRGLDRLRPGARTFDRFLGNLHVLGMSEGREGALWVGTARNLYRVDPASGAATPLFATPTVAFCPFEDRDGRLWTGTWRRGLLRYDPATDSTRSFTVADGLPSNMVRAVLQDALGRIWLSTEQGLAILDADTDEVLDVLGPDHGPFLGLQRGSAYRRADGQMLFGGTGGAVTVYPEQIRKNPVPPDVHVHRVRLHEAPLRPGDGRLSAAPWDAGASLTLDHHENDLAFEYVGIHFKNPEENRYRYRLEGYDDGWIEAGAQRAARYANVPPGRYTFRVTAANSDGVWNEAGAALAVVVRPPWWRTLPAYLAYVLLAAGGLVLTGRAQRRRIERVERERALAREVAQAREIEAQAREIEAGNARLAAANERLRANEAQLEAQYEQLRELDTLKTRFFANISHEFRTPLTLILGPLHDLLDEHFGALSAPQRAQLTLVQRNGQRLLRLINQLLDLAKLDAGEMTLRARRTDLGPLVAATAQAFASLAERHGVALHVEVPEAPVWLWVEPEKLEQVLVNLLSNAFKFTPDGGAVTVTLRPADDAVEVAVSDTGQGIPADALPHVFDRFRQADDSATRAHEGTGIGLALVHEWVALHGGAVGVESEVGVGTTFTVRLRRGRAHLPDEAIVLDGEGAQGSGGVHSAEASRVPKLLAAEKRAGDEAGDESAGAPSPPDASAGDAPADDAPLILIVEDNADVRAYLRNHLHADYRLAEAADGQDGLDQARALRPDLVLSDVMMPRLDGYALCRALKADAATEHVPVVLLTAKADLESRLDGLETGADDYLAKPFNADELLARVENLIELRRRLRARFSGEVVVRPTGVTVSSEDAAFVEQVRELVEAEMGDTQFSVERLADAVGLSPRQLRRRLKDTTGLSPSGLIRGMRLARAADLLGQDAGRVSDVAYAVGFSSASAFARAFQQVYGTAPSDYAPDERG